ncbi:hypothetical protein WA026_015199 [Henosepilachna vigintioctopunctata]|uniref:Endonuclease/exonuclease/phosphatase domain-containing protein n=1 Tax=Henosepilachna vigintioctopunctata TaxID=420089 RepID=A0AAW1TW60_9CUCU
MRRFQPAQSYWASNQDSKFGSELIAVIVKNNCYISNNGESTRILRPPENISVIDLTITESSFFPFVDNWKAETISLGSDHFPIRFTIKSRDILQRNIISSPKFNIRKPD